MNSSNFFLIIACIEAYYILVAVRYNHMMEVAVVVDTWVSVLECYNWAVEVDNKVLVIDN